jgi:hypothetical protein
VRSYQAAERIAVQPWQPASAERVLAGSVTRPRPPAPVSQLRPGNVQLADPLLRPTEAQLRLAAAQAWPTEAQLHAAGLSIRPADPAPAQPGPARFGYSGRHRAARDLPRPAAAPEPRRRRARLPRVLAALIAAGMSAAFALLPAQTAAASARPAAAAAAAVLPISHAAARQVHGIGRR